ncbi:hypothetical protein E5676_scaffold209G001370 [Cucumis melo var. makuwa]|uniref:Uncharacterized protein n=1 Tax=Cucumis melo var. makuwa TaxID=1194695 RepID=A0A5A7U2I2_CUCMM|nr:hypothetical protein E6C27_scaffold171G007850 [Cucumis melo var. makuwa]TYK16208.1 hypothetical protein E5676_scaffold209G001370 [Cucumis melo var. makuwa]
MNPDNNPNNSRSSAFDPASTTGGIQPAEKNPNSKAATAATAASNNMGKALAERAVYGTQQRRTGRRRRNLIHEHGAIRLLPSTLSRVSLADHHYNSPPSD